MAALGEKLPHVPSAIALCYSDHVEDDRQNWMESARPCACMRPVQALVGKAKQATANVCRPFAARYALVAHVYGDE